MDIVLTALKKTQRSYSLLDAIQSIADTAKVTKRMGMMTYSEEDKIVACIQDCLGPFRASGIDGLTSVSAILAMMRSEFPETGLPYSEVAMQGILIRKCRYADARNQHSTSGFAPVWLPKLQKPSPAKVATQSPAAKRAKVFPAVDDGAVAVSADIADDDLFAAVDEALSVHDAPRVEAQVIAGPSAGGSRGVVPEAAPMVVAAVDADESAGVAANVIFAAAETEMQEGVSAFGVVAGSQKISPAEVRYKMPSAERASPPGNTVAAVPPSDEVTCAPDERGAVQSDTQPAISKSHGSQDSGVMDVSFAESVPGDREANILESEGFGGGVQSCDERGGRGSPPASCGPLGIAVNNCSKPSGIGRSKPGVVRREMFRIRKRTLKE
ncbi:Hypothetical predicted protein [Cloeon dipterum]|uniref:Uncharacterized protein n=1 Tax=Cloeon dipterum TaxID=197152 RepID=A0A8S1DWU6_9INSE|nr:Hypothetical predicted protein [Cloeon dipterum]